MLQINMANLYRLLKDFYVLTKIRIVLFDSKFRELMSYPPKQQGFCGVLRATQEGDAKCSESDRGGCVRCTKTQGAAVYKCHAGLTEVVVPIQDQNGIFGYVMFGQIIPRESYEETKRQIERQYPQYASYIERIQAKTQEELDAAVTILQALTAYALTNHWVTPGKSEFVRQLDAYIAQNIHRAITAEDICAQFHIGRTRLYHIVKSYLGCGLAKHIQEQRVSAAQQMLLQTDMPVSNIAFAVGFSDYNHFSRVFKNVCGMSAREFRRTNWRSGAEQYH